MRKAGDMLVSLVWSQLDLEFKSQLHTASSVPRESFLAFPGSAFLHSTSLSSIVLFRHVYKAPSTVPREQEILRNGK